MPNWCENEIEISGSKKDIKKFIKLVTEKFDFNRITPMPKELQGVQSPVNIVSQKDYDKEQEEIKNATGKEKEHYEFIGMSITQKMSDIFKKKYGCNNWYDWAIQNWGVKWNTNSDNVICEIEDTWVRYEILTPWGPPEPICEKLRKLFPKLSISWFYNEPGMQMLGLL